MDKTTKSISSSCNNDDGVVPEETGMDKVLSDLHALKKLYRLLQRLDETSKALMNMLLDDALLKQAKALTTASDSVITFSLSLTSPKKTDQASSSFLNNKGAEMEQILSDLEALTSLYRLLHKGPGPAGENLDEASRALLMKILEDATQHPGGCPEAGKDAIRLYSSVPCAREKAVHAIRLPDTACRSAPEAASGLTQTKPPGQ